MLRPEAIIFTQQTSLPTNCLLGETEPDFHHGEAQNEYRNAIN